MSIIDYKLKVLFSSSVFEYFQQWLSAKASKRCKVREKFTNECMEANSSFLC